MYIVGSFSILRGLALDFGVELAIDAETLVSGRCL
jgi:hypothetical protein